MDDGEMGDGTTGRDGASAAAYRLVTLRAPGGLPMAESTCDVLLINPDEIDRAGLEDGQVVSLVGNAGDGADRRVDGLMVVPFDLPDGCVGAYRPEADPLIPVCHRQAVPDTAAQDVSVRISV